MHYVYDFDSTLYATDRLWRKWVQTIERFGYNTPELREVENQINERLKLPFTPRRHAELIGMVPPHIDAAIQEQNTDLISLGSSLLFDDVLPFLHGRHGTHKQSVLTFGDSDFQLGKIHASGIGEFIGSIQIASFDRGKAEFLQDLLEGEAEPIVFIDDHPRHLEAAHAAKLPIQLVRMKRSGEPHTSDEHPLDDIAWRCVSSLDELEPVVTDMRRAEPIF